VPSRKNRRQWIGGRSQANGGFALVFVVWCIGLLSLLFVIFSVAARYRSIEGLSLAAHAQSDAMARAAIHVAIFDLMSGLTEEKIRNARFPPNGDPVHCTLGGGSRIAISVGDEGGKVDLNAAGPDLVRTLLRSLYDSGTADRLSKRILDLRMSDPPAVVGTASHVAERHSNGSFRTILELDQLMGAESRDWRALLPLVTIHSQSPGIDAEVASADVLRALTGTSSSTDQRAFRQALPTEFAAPSSGRRFLVRADATVEPDARSTLEAVVEFSVDFDKGYRILEWRNGASRHIDRQSSARYYPSSC
jgi:general secretion pathway protein K